MKLLKGDIKLLNGIELADAIVRIDTVFDRSIFSINVHSKQEHISDDNPKGHYYFADNDNDRQTYFTATVYTSMENYKKGLVASEVLGERGTNAVYFNPEPDIAGMELLDAACEHLIKLYPGLTQI